MPYGDLSLLQQARAPVNTSGIQKFAYSLSPAGRQESAMRDLSIAEASAAARARRDAYMQREALAIEYENSGDTHVAKAIRAGINPEQIGSYDLSHQKLGSLAAMAAAADDPTVPLDVLNRKLMGAHGEPVQLTKVEGDTVINPYVSPENQSTSPTGVGSARMNELMALAGEHGAQAARANAGIGADKAANWELQPTANGIVRVNKLTGETQPLTMGGNNVVKAPPNPKAFTEHEMAAGLSTPDAPGKIDPLRFRQFENVKQDNPGKGDSDVFAALQAKDQEDEAAASTTGPPAALAGDGVSIMQHLFGGGAPATPAAQPTGPAAAPTQTAVNPKTGQRLGLVSGEWVPIQPPSDDAVTSAQPATLPLGARKAPDGNFYVPDPNRPGKYLRVDQ